MQLFNFFYFLLVALRCSVAVVVSFCFALTIAADAALKEEHVIDGRTIDVKRAVPRDRAPQPRLVRVTCSLALKRLGCFSL